MTINIKINYTYSLSHNDIDVILSQIYDSLKFNIHNNNNNDLYINYNIKKTKHYKKIKNNDPIIGDICNICHNEFQSGQFKKHLKCNHVFHNKCIDEWLKIKPNCPNCRLEVN